MTDLRTAAQQALEALTSRDGDGWTRRFARDRAIEALEAALAEPVQEPKPVAWMYEHDGMVHDADNPPFFMLNRWATPVNEPYTETPLYTSPPQRKPLTREEAIALWADKSDGPSNGEIVSFARAIERAHGIGGEE